MGEPPTGYPANKSKKPLTNLQILFPESGAEYTYIREAFGPLAAFLFVWVSPVWFSTASSAINAISAI